MKKNPSFFTGNQIPGFYLMVTLVFNLNHLNYFMKALQKLKYNNWYDNYRQNDHRIIHTFHYRIMHTIIFPNYNFYLTDESLKK